MLNEIRCHYAAKCASYSKKCDKCKHNKIRNYIPDYFEKAHDRPFPIECPKLTYEGPAEQTDGYKCPVCGCCTNPYHLDDYHRCSSCGYVLNV